MFWNWDILNSGKDYIYIPPHSKFWKGLIENVIENLKLDLTKTN